jgi:hypothetical protein
MIQVSVKADVEQARLGLVDLQRNQVPRAAARALNRTRDNVQTVVVREVAKETGLKQKDVREALSRTNATAGRLLSVLAAVGRAVNLIRFTNQNRTQARRSGGVVANAWSKRRLYRGTFIGNQGRTVFVRVGPARLPIKAVHGPSIPREIERDTIRPIVERTIRERWPINFAADLKFFLGKL